MTLLTDPLRARLAAILAEWRTRQHCVPVCIYDCPVCGVLDDVEAALRAAPEDARTLERAIAGAMREKAKLFRHDVKARRAILTAADGLDHFAADLEAGLWRDFLHA